VARSIAEAMQRPEGAGRSSGRALVAWDWCGVGDLIWMRDIEREDPALFEFIFRVQDYSYRKSKFTHGLVWDHESFRERSRAYVVFGTLPTPNAAGCYPSVEEALSAKMGFVLARPLPAIGPPFVCLKFSVLGGHLRGILDATADTMKLGLPVLGAMDPKLARVARRVGYRILPRRAARFLAPILVRAFMQPPWTYRGVGPEGQILACHPHFREPTNGDFLIYDKMVIYSPDMLRRILRLGYLSAAAALIVKSLRREHH
jgi:hypothetical protein